jgi:WD40 repeat protein
MTKILRKHPSQSAPTKLLRSAARSIGTRFLVLLTLCCGISPMLRANEANDKTTPKYGNWATPAGFRFVFDSVFSPDNRSILIPQGVSGAILRDAETGKNIQSFATDRSENVRRAAFHPNGKMLFTAHSSRVILWDITSGEPIRQFRTQLIIDFEVNFDGTRIVTTERNGKVIIWDVASGEVLKKFELGSSGTRGASGIRRTSVDKSFKRLLVAWYMKPPQLISLKTGESIREFNTSGSVPREAYRFNVHADLSDDAERALTGTRLGYTVVWDTRTGEAIRQFNSPRPQRGASMQLSRDGKTVLLGTHGDGQSASLWDVATGEITRQFATKSPDGFAAFCSDESKVAVAAGKYELVVFDAMTSKRLSSIRSETTTARRVVTCSSGNPVIFQWDEGLLNHFDFANNKLTEITDASLSNPALSRDGKVVASLTSEWTASVWRAADKRELAKIKWSHTKSSAMSLDGTGERLALGHNDGTCAVFDAKTGKVLYEMPQIQGQITNLSLSSDGEKLLAGYQCSTSVSVKGKVLQQKFGLAILWEVKTGQQLQQTQHNTTVTATDISDDGQRILTAGHASAFLSNAATGQLICKYSTSPGVYPYRNAWLGGDGKKVFIYPYTTGGLYTDSNNGQGTFYLGQIAAPSYSGGDIFWRRIRHHFAACDAKTGNVLLRIHAINETEWLAFTPTGLYDGSSKARKHVQFNLQDFESPNDADDTNADDTNVDDTNFDDTIFDDTIFDDTIFDNIVFQQKIIARQERARLANFQPRLIQEIFAGKRPLANPLD